MVFMKSFDGIIEFVAVAQSKSFTAAAKRLDVNTSQVSRKIAALEQHLGIALFVRSTRNVRLTEAGSHYFKRCEELVNGLEEANEDLTGEQVNLSGVLRVSAAGEFAEQFIAPALMAFAANHPALKIEMNFNSNMVNFVEEGFDFSIRYGQLSDSSLIATKLAKRSLIAVASPSYLSQYGEPTHPSELSDHHCLITNNPNWRFEQKFENAHSKPFSVKVKGKWQSNSGRSIAHACKMGLGIAYMPKSSFTQGIAEGALKPILAPYWSTDVTTWIVYPNRQYVPARVRMAINYLQDHFKDWQE